MNPKEPLKACPFCGNGASYKYLHEGPWFFVQCPREESCGAETGAFRTRKEAIKAWNRREKWRVK